MVKINLIYVILVVAGTSLNAMNFKDDIRRQGPNVARELIGDGWISDEPEHVRLWKEWMSIKDSALPHFPFRDASENVEQLRWLVEKRKSELLQKNAK